MSYKQIRTLSITQKLDVPFKQALACLTEASQYILDLLKHDLVIIFWKICNLNPFKTNLMEKGYSIIYLGYDDSSRLKI